MKLVLKDNGDYAFSGRVVKITKEKNKDCAGYGKQVLNYNGIAKHGIFIIAAVILIAAATGCSSATGSKDNEYEAYVLTEKEKDLLTDTFGNEENIKNNELYDYQKEALIQLREAEEYIAKKYPSHSVEILRFENATKLTGQGECYCQDESRNEFFVYIIPVNGKYECRDTYYGILIREKYDRDLEGILTEKGITVKTYTSFSSPAGMEADEDSDLYSINRLDPKPTRCTHIFAEGEGNTPSAEIESILKENGAYGSYILYSVPHEDMLSDISVLEESRNKYTSSSFSCF